MAQLRQDRGQFVARDAGALVIEPEDWKTFQDCWQKESLPLLGLADLAYKVANRHVQEGSSLRLGRAPALMVVDSAGEVCFQHDAGAMFETSPSTRALAVWDGLASESGE